MKTYGSVLIGPRLFGSAAVLTFFVVAAGLTIFPKTTSATLTTAVKASEARSQHLVEFKGNRLPSNLSERITALGGSIVDTLPEINVVIVADMTADAAASLAAQPDVSDVTTDDFIQLKDSKWARAAVSMPVSDAPTSATDPMSAQLFPFQWDKRVIRADRAWQAGFLGSPDVSVAIIDTGIDPFHPELVGLIDPARSVSFVTEETPLVQQEFSGYPAWTDLYGHGTFTAGIVSSHSNLVAGVTSRTTLMAIKVLGLVPSRGSNILRGIIYAANHGADVINISLVSAFPITRAGSKNRVHYDHLAVQYALVKGVSAVVVAAGNDAFDFDHGGNLISQYCDVPGVICVSATGPTDSGPSLVGPFQNIDAPALYTNFGVSAIDVAGPGGNISFDAQGNLVGSSYVFGTCATTDRQFDSAGNLVPGFCTGLGIKTDGVIGTSEAAPHVSGLAALLVSQFGHGHAAQVRAAIENSADDLGKPGADPFYGKGRINVARALGIR